MKKEIKNMSAPNGENYLANVKAHQSLTDGKLVSSDNIDKHELPEQPTGQGLGDAACSLS